MLKFLSFQFHLQSFLIPYAVIFQARYTALNSAIFKHTIILWTFVNLVPLLAPPVCVLIITISIDMFPIF